MKENQTMSVPVTMTDDQYRARIGQLASRVEHVLPGARRHVRQDGQIVQQALSQLVKADLDGMIQTLAENKTPEEYINLVKAANQGNQDARQQLCSLRVQTYNNYILASQQKLGFFFDLVDLAEDETPYEQNETKQELVCSYVGADGQPPTTRVVKPQDESRIPLHWVTSEEYEYTLVDPYRGRIAESAKATVMLGYDLKNAMEAKLFAMLTRTVANGGAYGDFSLTGKKSLRTFLPNSYINVANLPTTNDIVLEETSGTTRFRYDVFREIAKYGAQWADAFPEGPLVPTGRVLVPSLDASDIARAITPTGSTSNAVADRLLEQGWDVVEIHGRKYTILADNTLAPGTCYAEYNRKPGTAYTKSALDEEIVDDSKAMRKKNKESRFARKLLGGSINSARRIFTARFKYRN